MSFRVQLRASLGRYVVFWWVLKSAGNGAVLATSEKYTSRRKAYATAHSLAQALGVEVEEDT